MIKNQDQPMTFQAIQKTYGRTVEQAAGEVRSLSLSGAAEARLAFSVLLTAMQDWLRGDDDARAFLFDSDRAPQLGYWLKLAQWDSSAAGIVEFRLWVQRNDPRPFAASPDRLAAASSQTLASALA